MNALAGFVNLVRPADSRYPAGNVIPHATVAWLAEGKKRGLRGGELRAYVDKKLVMTGREVVENEAETKRLRGRRVEAASELA